MASVKQWPRKVECTLCAEPHQVDARGFKQHQNKVRSEQSVVKNDPIEADAYRVGFRDGWIAAMAESGGVLTKAA